MNTRDLKAIILGYIMATIIFIGGLGLYANTWANNFRDSLQYMTTTQAQQEVKKAEEARYRVLTKMDIMGLTEQELMNKADQLRINMFVPKPTRKPNR